MKWLERWDQWEARYSERQSRRGKKIAEWFEVRFCGVSLGTLIGWSPVALLAVLAAVFDPTGTMAMFKLLSTWTIIVLVTIAVLAFFLWIVSLIEPISLLLVIIIVILMVR